MTEKPISIQIFWDPYRGDDSFDGMEPTTAVCTFDAFLLVTMAFRKSGMQIVPMYYMDSRWILLGDIV